MTGFTQSPPRLDNQYQSDRVLRAYLDRYLPADMLTAAEADLDSMGRLAGGELYQQQLAERSLEPELTQWDPWGERIDHIRLTPLWQRAQQLAANYGLVGTAYEGDYQPHGRLVQFALVYLFHPSTDVYTCPLAMTDGAARALLESGNRDLIARAVAHLTSRDPDRFWTSGQWMTETTGGSDVSATETVARRDQDQWRLYGRKWFTSAATSEVALTLARPEGNPGGGRGLALFYLEPRDEHGQLRDIRILRLKDKLGTRKLPTAELRLDGVRAVPVNGLDNGVKNITPMLNITRTWNSVCAVSFMRRGLALARDYADRRIAFNQPLSEHPLHLNTLAGLQAELEGAFLLTFEVVRLLGLAENGRLDESQRALLRLLIPIAKLLTGKQSVATLSEVMESFGGAGYMEDTGLPTLLRDTQVLPIWEGTTNVLSLDVLRVIQSHPEALKGLLARAGKLLDAGRDERLAACSARGQQILARLSEQLRAAQDWDTDQWQAAGRDFAITIGRLYSLGLLVEHGQYLLDNSGDPRSAAAAARYARNGLGSLWPADLAGDRALATDIYV